MQESRTWFVRCCQTDTSCACCVTWTRRRGRTSTSKQRCTNRSSRSSSTSVCALSNLRPTNSFNTVQQIVRRRQFIAPLWPKVNRADGLTAWAVVVPRHPLSSSVNFYFYCFFSVRLSLILMELGVNDMTAMGYKQARSQGGWSARTTPHSGAKRLLFRRLFQC